MKAAIRSKPEPKPKATKVAPKKPVKAKAAARTKASDSSPTLPLSERRRSGREHKVSNYKDTEDMDDEAEMLDGVAEWEYGGKAGRPAAEDEVESDEEEDADEPADDDDEEDEDEKPARNGRKAAGSRSKDAPAIKASVLSQLKGAASRKGQVRGGRGGRDDEEDMDVDDY